MSQKTSGLDPGVQTDFFCALDSPRKGPGYVPPPPKPTTSEVSIDDCDEALTLHAQDNVKSSKKKPRAKSHIPMSGITKIRLSEFSLLRKTEPNLPSHSELTSSLLFEKDEL